MTREELMKLSKKELKNRAADLGKKAQAFSGQELTDAMDEARLIGEILDEIKVREELMAAATAAGTADPEEGAEEPGAGEGSQEPKNQARAKSGRALKDGKKVTFKAKALASPRNALSTANGIVMPQHDSPDISPTFNNVSSLIDRVHTVPLPGGESYRRPYVVSYGDGAGSTAEGADYNASEPVFNYAEIVREKITAYAEEPEEMIKLPDADYDAVVEDSVTRAIKRYASRQILVGPGGTGKFRGIFFNPTEEKEQVIDPSTDITTITAIDDGTLDEIIYSYGGDKQDRKVYTLKHQGNTGTNDEVPFIINTACGEVGGTAGAYAMAYGPLSNYEVAIFSDIDARKSEHYKFKQGQVAYRADVFMGGNVVAKNGFIRVKNPAAN